MGKSVNEGTIWPQSSLPAVYEIALDEELKKLKGIWVIKKNPKNKFENDIFRNGKKILTMNGNQSVNVVIKKIKSKLKISESINEMTDDLLEDSEYQDFFKMQLVKAGKKITDMSDEEKKEFFDGVKKSWEKHKKNESVNEHKYLAFYNDKKVEIDGKDLYDAKQKAIKLFKVPKSKRGLLGVRSIEGMAKGDFRFDSLKEETDIPYTKNKEWIKTPIGQAEQEFYNKLRKNKTIIALSKFYKRPVDDVIMATRVSVVRHRYNDKSLKSLSLNVHVRDANMTVKQSVKYPKGKIVNESINESVSSDIDTLANESKNFKSFVKAFFDEYSDFPKNKEGIKYLETIWNSKSKKESLDERFTTSEINAVLKKSKDFEDFKNNWYEVDPWSSKHRRKAATKNWLKVTWDTRPKNESITEVAGYRLKKADKETIERFVTGMFDYAIEKQKPNASWYVRKNGKTYELKGPHNTIATSNGHAIDLVGVVDGNVTQTVVNFVEKVAKKNNVPIVGK